MPGSPAASASRIRLEETGFAVEHHRRDRLGDDVIVRAELAQHLGIAAAAAAECEVLAGDDARGADPLGEQVGDEILGAGRRRGRR